MFAKQFSTNNKHNLSMSIHNLTSPRQIVYTTSTKSRLLAEYAAAPKATRQANLLAIHVIKWIQIQQNKQKWHSIAKIYTRTSRTRRYIQT
jgi:hypothetical protein